MSHYETLGVAADATAAEIKRAYRRSASQAHPDQGGTDEAMQAVNRAYECLSDPKRRAFYDQTGLDQPRSAEVKQLMEKLIAEEAHDCLGQMFEQQLGQDLTDREMLAATRKRLTIAIRNAAEHKTSGRDAIGPLQARRERISVAEGSRNLVHENLDRRIKACEDLIKQAEHGLLVFKAALKLLDDYQTTEPPPAPREPEPVFPRSLTRSLNLSGRFYDDDIFRGRGA